MGVTLKTFSKRSGNFRQLAEKFQREVLSEMVEKAVEVSPVDTAAYVDSFGFNNPQGFNSKDRPRTRPGPSTDPDAAKQRNISRLLSEVSTLSLDGPVVFGNSAPHAGIVEDLHQPVFAIVRREFTNIARRSLQKVKSNDGV